MKVRAKESTPNLYERPTYGLAEAAHYLAVPPATLRAWVHGRPYPVRGGTRKFQPILRLARGQGQLSFSNLVEAQIIRGLRKAYQIDLSKIRNAVAYARTKFQDPHPLLNPRMSTNGVDLFWQWAQTENLSRGGQFAIREILDAHLKRVSWADGNPIRLYPFRRWDEDLDAATPVMIDPKISFGRPVVAGTGIPTAVIAERFQGGEGIEELAADYGMAVDQVQEAIRRETALVKAA